MDARREMELPGAALEGEDGAEEGLMERPDEDLGSDDESAPIPAPCVALVVSSPKLPNVASPVRERRLTVDPSSPEAAKLDTPTMLTALPPIERIRVVLAVLPTSTSGLLSRALGVRRCPLRD